DGMRSVGILISIARVANRLLQFHPLPVGIQFVCQNERNRSAAAGAHLRAVCYQMHGSVGVDSNKSAGMKGRAIGVGGRRSLLRPQEIGNQTHAQDESAGGNNSLQKSTPADVENVVAHAFSPAAALIAARIRW